MSVSSTTNRVSYAGDGTTDTFTVSYPFLEKSHLKVLLNGVLQTLNTHYEVYFTQEIEQPSNPSAWGPTGRVEFITPPALDGEVIIYRELPPIQELEAQPNVRIPSPDIETALDRIYMVIQRILELFNYIPRFADSFDMGGFNKTLPSPLPGTIVQVNEDGDGFIAVTPQEIVAEALSEGGAGLPLGGEAFALVEKKSADPGDADWTAPLVYQGFSEEYNEIVDIEGIKEFADYVMKMGYAPPNVNLSSNVSNALRERGDAVTSMTLTAAITRVLNDVAQVRFYIGASLLDTQSSGGGIPAGGNSTYAWAGSFSNNTTFSVQVDDTSVQAKPSRTAQLVYSFVYPYYVGAGAPGLSAASVAGLTKRIINSTATRPETISATVGQVFYFAYPASYGALTSILDASNFETIGDWTLRTENITGLDGNAVSYRIYEFDNVVGVSGSYLNTFKR